MEHLKIDAGMGEKIRFYRKQAGLTQKGLADLCGVSDATIRNYELGNRVPDFLMLKTISEQLRVSYYAIADVYLPELGGALQALFQLEEIYGFYPILVDGHVHFVFRDSITLEDMEANPSIVLNSSGTLLQRWAFQFRKACELRDSGEWSEEKFIQWKSKLPEFEEDLRQEGLWGGTSDGVPESGALPMNEPKLPAQRRKRKINERRKL